MVEFSLGGRMTWAVKHQLDDQGEAFGMRMRSCLNANGILLVKQLALGGMNCAVVAELEMHYQVPAAAIAAVAGAAV